MKLYNSVKDYCVDNGVDFESLSSEERFELLQKFTEHNIEAAIRGCEAKSRWENLGKTAMVVAGCVAIAGMMKLYLDR